MIDLDKILMKGFELEASDVHFKVGRKPIFRIHGTLVPYEDWEEMTGDALSDLLLSIMNQRQRRIFEENHHTDLSYSLKEMGRFRVNVFQRLGTVGAVFRFIPPEVKGAGQLNLPLVINRIADEQRGLVVVTGVTGSGKSTTLAAMISHINSTRAAHVITIEDPIEFLHQDNMCIINQREIGLDTNDFAGALRAALREDPDVILVGEMRDLETIETAILAAETGHLVMSTLHTLDAPETVNRVISVFPPHQQEQVRLQLSSIIRGIICQRLVPTVDGKGRVPAVEVMISTARTRECIADREKTKELRDAIAAGFTTYGMQTFDQSLMGLLSTGLITFDEAMKQATNPDDFALKVKGISSTSDAGWSEVTKSEEDPRKKGPAVTYEEFKKR